MFFEGEEGVVSVCSLPSGQSGVVPFWRKEILRYKVVQPFELTLTNVMVFVQRTPRYCRIYQSFLEGDLVRVWVEEPHPGMIKLNRYSSKHGLIRGHISVAQFAKIKEFLEASPLVTPCSCDDPLKLIPSTQPLNVEIHEVFYT